MCLWMEPAGWREPAEGSRGTFRRKKGGRDARTHARTNERMNEWNLSNVQKSQHVPSKVALSHLVSLRAVTHSNSEQV